MSDNTRFDVYMKQQLADRDFDVMVHKFGRAASLTTSFTPVAIGSIYRTPQVSGATKLRVKAGNTNDTAAGSGARKVLIQGLDETGTERMEELTTAGTSAGSPSRYTYIRLYRAYVTESGTYATQAAGSHAAAITIENAAGTQDWLTIDATSYPRGQSEVGAYTIPLGYEGYVYSIKATVDSNKTADLVFYQRRNILETAAPYSAVRTIRSFFGVVGQASYLPPFPDGPYPALTDLGFMAKASATTELEVEFQIMLVRSSS